MQRANQTTDYILIRANTNSPWDNCELAIVHLSDEYRATLQNRLNTLKPLAGDTTLSGICYWEGPEGFYNSPADYSLADEIVDTSEEWTYINVDPGELDYLPVPESKLDTYRLTITPGGAGYFSAYGKHTGEEFWTDHFDIAALIAQQTGKGR